MSIVWATTARNHTEKLVLLALADNANDQGVCWPSIATLAKKCDLTEQGVLNRIDLLEKAGQISIKKTPGKSNTYTINPPTPLSATTQQRLPLNAVYPPTPLTTPPNAVECHPPTPLSAPPNAVESNHKEPSLEPSGEPSSSAPSAAVIGSLDGPVLNKQPETNGKFHTEFMEAWCFEFQAFRGEKYDVYGAKDGSAVKRLAATGRTVKELIALAKAAWSNQVQSNWSCCKAESIAFFASHLNEIRAELRNGKTSTRPQRVSASKPHDLEARDFQII